MLGSGGCSFHSTALARWRPVSHVSALLPRLFAIGAGRAKHIGQPLLLAAFALAYFLAAKLGIATSLPPDGIVILWPPNAIVLAALLAVDRKKWPLYLITTVATEIAADVPDYPFWAAAGYGVV